MAKGKVGRPPKNDPDDVEAIQAKIDAYFSNLKQEEDLPTYCGLALALGYSSRTTLWNNANANSKIAEPIKRAMLMVDESYERQLRTTSPTGAIFALKNRGWRDKPEDDDNALVLSKLDNILDNVASQARKP